MNVQLVTGVRTSVRNSIPASASPRRAGDMRPQRAQFSGRTATRWATNTTLANVQNVTTGTGGPAPGVGTNSRSNMLAAVENVGDRNRTSESANAEKVSAIRNAVPGSDSSSE